jgi:hypothetical protein
LRLSLFSLDRSVDRDLIKFSTEPTSHIHSFFNPNPPLQESIIEYIDTNSFQVISHKTFTGLHPSSTLMEAVSRDDLNLIFHFQTYVVILVADDSGYCFPSVEAGKEEEKSS